jgi:thiaminase
VPVAQAVEMVIISTPSAEQRQRMEAAFLTSSRYEYQFWEASLNLEVNLFGM